MPLRKHTFTFDLTKKYPVKNYDPASLKRAQGSVKITNLRSEDLDLIKNTRVATDTLVFRLLRNVTVPAAKDSIPGELTVTVVADPNGSNGTLIGSKGNIPANTTLVFPGLSQIEHELVRVVSVNDFTGGEDSFANLLSAEEYTALETTFREQLINEARDSIIHSFPSSSEYIPLPIADVLTTVEMVITPDVPVGTYTQELNLTGKGTFDIYLYHVPTLRKILIQSAQNHLLEKVESLVEISQSPPDIIAELAKTEEPFTVKRLHHYRLRSSFTSIVQKGRRTPRIISPTLLRR